METFDKPGCFFLGKELQSERPVFYDSKYLTTHAVCVGMTGSGKTGLGIALLEEAALSGVPALIIDPKGDMTNLALAFPGCTPEEFAPWIDSGSESAEEVARSWKEGQTAWGEEGKVSAFKNSVEVEIYTPANRAGRPLSILSSLAAPSKEFLQDTGAVRDRILTLTSGLLGLIGISADPLKSREHIMISNLIQKAWEQGESLDLPELIKQIQNPPFARLGALDLDTFFPAKERMALAVSLNNLLASPGFQAWMEGESLDIQKLLYTHEGKPKLSVLYIAHLSEPERMFFVTLLLNEVLSWMRKLPGTSNLRALLYMDEIFGYFPPTQSPPSKLPMLTLLKQARAYGLGVILSTQNPVDLDYKGLANCGTWFIGKLQTERDKARILEGLVSSSQGQMEASTLNKLLSTQAKRSFLLQSIYLKEPIVFQTRWTLSYLRGPLTLTQIEKLTPAKTRTEPAKAPIVATAGIPIGIQQYFIRPVSGESPQSYRPFLGALAKLHYVEGKSKLDTWEEVALVVEMKPEAAHPVAWEEAEEVPGLKERFETKPLPGVAFKPAPESLLTKANFDLFEKELKAWLYQNRTLSVTAGPSDQLERKIAAASEKVRKAQMKVAQKQEKASLGKTSTLISFGTTLLGAFLGKGVTKGTVTQAGTSMRRAGKMNQEAEELAAAEADLAACRDQLAALETERGQNSLSVQEKISPRKTDIIIETLALIWWPVG